ncbi:MAG TPA: tRNA lysidine(34) synthetase TilS [Kiritimatiellia bacterium]|nr:tRNA lysidine(34) synthetase TilS [Kiritimatiellia bacterium]HRZ12481.1 tRNA lysidine(34) synthetase TilS [Kiritimatiellia bacterium]HSA17761.1 tRNA lysidine(34) synthetase TilS [Kiritimatiellia bacterium]
MLQIIQRAIRRQNLVTPGTRLLLAVSGGADSTALAAALAGLRVPLNLRLTLAHLNHGIRGAEADDDARFVRALARRLRAGFVLGRADVPGLSRKKGISIEMAAREARYDFLARAARRAGADAIATAHTADDQAETVLLRLARGTGPQGLAGIPYRSEHGGVPVIRPMLDATRAQVEAFLKRRGLGWREDSTNRNPEHLRNRVRHEIIPLLEARLNPCLREALCRLASLAGEENRWMEQEAARLAFDGFVAQLAGLPVPLARRALRAWLSKTGVPPESLDFEAIERVRALAEGRRGGGSAPLPGGWRVTREAGALRIQKAGRAGPSSYSTRLKVPGVSSLASGWRVRVVRGRGYAAPSAAGNLEAWVDAGRVGRSPLMARSWRPGDRIRLVGLAGSKKLQDLFVDLKIPREQRLRIPVIECKGEILWVPGSRVSRDWAVSHPQAPSWRLSARLPPAG